VACAGVSSVSSPLIYSIIATVVSYCFTFSPLYKRSHARFIAYNPNNRLFPYTYRM